MSCNFDNKKTILDYFNMAFIRQDPENAATLYLHENYVHYGEGSMSNRGDFVEYFSNFFKKNPEFKVEILHCVAEDEMVVLRVTGKESRLSNDKEVAEFYRLDSGKIKEHWHVIGRYSESFVGRHRPARFKTGRVPIDA